MYMYVNLRLYSVTVPVYLMSFITAKNEMRHVHIVPVSVKTTIEVHNTIFDAVWQRHHIVLNACDKIFGGLSECFKIPYRSLGYD